MRFQIPATFWNFEEKHRGQITSVTFEFAAPNMFDIRSDLDAGLRNMRDKENVQTLTMSFRNPDGLTLARDRIEPAVSYATKDGAGSIRVRTKSGQTFSSKKKVRTVSVGGDHGASEKQAVPLKERILRAVNAIREVFTNET